MARKSEQKSATSPASPSDPKSRQGEAAARLGQQLRSIYADALAERVPDSFEDLLKKLR